MLEALKQAVYAANIDLVRHGLVLFTWGNVSGIDHESGLHHQIPLHILNCIKHIRHSAA